MNRTELSQEIDRVTYAIQRTHSKKLKRDYHKYKKRLEREARDYDRFHGGSL